MSFIILNGNSLNPAAYQEDTYVNITTNRINKTNKVMNSYEVGKIFNLETEGPYIWATEEQFKEFCRINKNVIFSKKDVENVILTENKNFSQNIENNNNIKTENNKKLIKNNKMDTSFEDSLKDVFPDIDKHAICKNNTLDRQSFIPRTNNPHDLPKEALHSLTNFQINGFSGPAVVTNVIDGDTIYIVVYVPLSALANGHEYSYYSKKGIRSFIHTRFMNAGFFAKVKCRISEIDAMEEGTVEGKFAKALTIDLYQRYNKVG
jgi:hypothetical protein